MKKSLIEGYKNYWKEYLKFRKTFELKIEHKLGDILRILGYDYIYIEKFELINNDSQVFITYTINDTRLFPYDTSVYPPAPIHNVALIPIEYLDMSKKEIVNEVKKKKELEQKAQEECERVLKEKEQKEIEKRERKEYERLKKKYER